MNRNDKQAVVMIRLYMNNCEPMTTKEFCNLCGISPRDLQHAIRALRLKGMKICSGDAGYWLWNGQDDSWNHTKAQIKHRLAELSILYSAMNRTPLEGQQTWQR